LHVLRIPRLDAPAEIVEYRKARSTRTAAARAAAVGRCLLARRRRRRRLITAAQDETAPVPNVEHRLLTVVASDLPVHESGVVGGLLRVIHRLAGEVIEQDRLPARRLERELGGRRIALGCSGASTSALPLRERRRRTNGRGDTECFQQLTARQPEAI